VAALKPGSKEGRKQKLKSLRVLDCCSEIENAHLQMAVSA